MQVQDPARRGRTLLSMGVNMRAVSMIWPMVVSESVVKWNKRMPFVSRSHCSAEVKPVVFHTNEWAPQLPTWMPNLTDATCSPPHAGQEVSNVGRGGHAPTSKVQHRYVEWQGAGT